MTTLIEKLESASEGSRDLDAEIAVAIFDEPKQPDDLIYAKASREDDQCAPGTYWRISRSGASLRTAPRYTTSIDAALTLVPEGWLPVLRFYRGSANCRLNKWPPGSTHSVEFVGKGAATPALALCIAALKAREAQ